MCLRPHSTPAWSDKQPKSAFGRELPTRGDHRFGSLVDGLDDFGVVDSAEVSRRDGEVGVAELALDHDQRDPFTRHLHRMRVPQLMRREPAAAPGRNRGVVELSADASRCARPAACRSAQDAEKSSDRQGRPHLEPRREVRPRPAIHTDLAALIALAMADEQRAAFGIEVGLVERERFADPQPGAPEYDDHAAQPDAVRTITGSAHHRDDLLHGRRIRWIPKALVARRNASVEAGRGRR